MKKLMAIALSISIILVTIYCNGELIHANNESYDNVTEGVVNVEFSDSNKTEQLSVKLVGDNLYANAKELCERLGYTVGIGDEAVVISNTERQDIPFGVTCFFYDSTKVKHMVFTKIYDNYNAPFPSIKEGEIAWIPMEYACIILNSSMLILDDTIMIDMPKKSIMDTFVDLTRNAGRYGFNWYDDENSAGAVDIMSNSALVVNLVNGLISKDGASWAQYFMGLVGDSTPYDMKYGQEIAKLLCTYSNEEMHKEIKRLKESMQNFTPDGKLGKVLMAMEQAVPSDASIEELQDTCATLLKQMEEGNGDIAKYNWAYMTLDKALTRQESFENSVPGISVDVLKSVKEATEIVEVMFALAEVSSYIEEFVNQDAFSIDAVIKYANSKKKNNISSEHLKEAMLLYSNELRLNIVLYSGLQYLSKNYDKLMFKAADISLGATAEVLLAGWSIASKTVPWLKNGLDDTDAMLISLYAEVLETDAYISYLSLRDDIFNKSDNVDPKDLYELSQICYVYLKSSYIARDEAIGILNNSTNQANLFYADSLRKVNEEIADLLIKIKDADNSNEGYIYGFLPCNTYIPDYKKIVKIKEMLRADGSSTQMQNKRLEKYKLVSKESYVQSTEENMLYDEKGTIVSDEQYVFDECGILCLARDIKYDSYGRIIYFERTGMMDWYFEVRYHYDENGNIVKVERCADDGWEKRYYVSIVENSINDKNHLIESVTEYRSDETYTELLWKAEDYQLEYDADRRLIQGYDEYWGAPVKYEYVDTPCFEICKCVEVVEEPYCEWHKSYALFYDENGFIKKSIDTGWDVQDENDVLRGNTFKGWDMKFDEDGYLLESSSRNYDIFFYYIESVMDDKNYSSQSKDSMFEGNEQDYYGHSGEEVSNSDLDIFKSLPSKFVFTNGLAWATEITLHDDGSFEGTHHDSEMEYFDGTIYICNFSGKFSMPKKISEYIYSMNLETLNVEGTPGTVYYENNIKYIVSDPSGFDNASEFLIYFPGCPLEDTSEVFLLWSSINTEIRDTMPNGVYGIFNVGGDAGFMGEDENSWWLKNYNYNYNSYKSTLWPNYGNKSHLFFWREFGSSVLDIMFDWSGYNQTDFFATDSKGTGNYNISIEFNEDCSSVIVTVKSLSGYNLEPWGGTADGMLSVEYQVTEGL